MKKVVLGVAIGVLAGGLATAWARDNNTLYGHDCEKPIFVDATYDITNCTDTVTYIKTNANCKYTGMSTDSCTYYDASPHMLLSFDLHYVEVIVPITEFPYFKVETQCRAYAVWGPYKHQSCR